MPLPLAGIRVLDLTRLFPGGFATLLLADLGADVIKVEDFEGGDYLRWVPPPHLFQALNRGKRSLALDLRSPAGREAFLKLAARADVVVESFRPGAMERLELGWETLRRANPALIYCAISGYGQPRQSRPAPRDKRADSDDRSLIPQSGTALKPPDGHPRAGHDINFVALAGLLSGSDRPLPVQVADFCGGYAAALAIVAAVRGRDRSGQGAFLDISLAGSALPLLLTRLGVHQLEGELACYNVYETADGRRIAVGALEPKFFERLLAIVGRPELMPLHSDAARQEELKRELAAAFRTRTRDEWQALFAESDACVEAVSEPEEALRQLAGNDPARLTTPLGRNSSAAAPGHGEHSEQVLSEFGFSAGEIAALRSSAAIK